MVILVSRCIAKTGGRLKTRIFGNEGRLVPPGNQWRSVPNLLVFGNEGSLVPPGNQRRSVPNLLANRDNALLSKRRIPAV